ncbi:MAG: beta-ketoacyl-[acyl-carrier-protein] synthase family protein [Kineosporiaceae bacterium]
MAPSHDPVVVVGAGLKAPGGLTPDELFASLCAGASFVEPFADCRLPADVAVPVARVRGLDVGAYLPPVQARRFDRCHHLAVAAARDALDAVAGPLPPPERRALVCGVGLGVGAYYERQHEVLLDRGLRAVNPLTVPVVMPSSPAALLSLRHDIRGPVSTVSTACASGATAIGEGAELLRRGAADLVLAGGVDALVTYGVVCSFLRLDAMTRNVADPQTASRPFDVDRDGFLLAEGAGFVVLQRLSDVADARAVLGTVAGYGTCAEAHHLVAPEPGGEGALRCMRLALADAGLAPADVQHVNAHGTSTKAGDLAEAAAISRLFAGAPPPVTAVKGTTGHMIGGSGAVEAIMTIQTLRSGTVPPVAGSRRVDPAVDLDVVVDLPRAVPPGYALSNSFGFGGVDVCLVLGPPP